jgi:radical SAM superfamily enzyme
VSNGLGLRLFEKKVMKITFGPRREEERGGCRISHNEKLHNLYFSPYYSSDQSRENAITSAHSTYGRDKYIQYFSEKT